MDLRWMQMQLEFIKERQADKSKVVGRIRNSNQAMVRQSTNRTKLVKNE